MNAKNKFWKLVILIASALVLASHCAFAQSLGQTQRSFTLPKPMFRMPGGQSQEQQAADQIPSAAIALTLEQLQQMALQNNPTLRQAQAQIRAAAGRTLQAGLWPNPTVGYTSEEIRGGSFGGGQQGVFVQQDVILGGKLGLERKIFAEEGKQSEAEADEQRLRVENGVRIAFYQSLAAQQMVQTRMKLSELAKDAVETTQQLFNVGQADQPDLLEAQVEADESELALTASQQDQQRAWRVLTALVNVPTMPLTRLEGNLEDLPSIDPDQTLQTILRDSPAMKIAQLSVTRADAALARAKREIVPDLSLRAGIRNDLESLETVPRTVGPVGFAEVGVNLRLFNRNQGNIQAAKADQEGATLNVQRVSLVLRQMAAPVLQNYISSRAVADKYKTTTLPTAQRAYELYMQRYREGAAAYPQVLIAQRTLFQLQTNYVSALENVWMNAVTLQGLLLTDGLDLPAAPGELEQPIREINLPLTEAPGGRQ
ncbi:MAG TPA: TolC family protein [Candidatus Acidoferrales bacterium]|nr:TolC family protein [Candidatus Acidoferrales bacterium]